MNKFTQGTVEGETLCRTCLLPIRRAKGYEASAVDLAIWHHPNGKESCEGFGLWARAMPDLNPKRKLESVAPPSVAMQPSEGELFYDGIAYLMLQTSEGPTMFAEIRGNGAGLPQDANAKRLCDLWNAGRAALPVAASGEGSEVPTSENDRLCRAYLDLAASYAERNQLKIELDELKAALSSPLHICNTPKEKP